jgi:thymidylate synthase ThyX
MTNKLIEMSVNLINYSKFTYPMAIKNGIAKEQARAVLPEGINC